MVDGKSRIRPWVQHSDIRPQRVAQQVQALPGIPVLLRPPPQDLQPPPTQTPLEPQRCAWLVGTAKWLYQPRSTIPSHRAVSNSSACIRFRSFVRIAFRVCLMRFATGLRPNPKRPVLVRRQKCVMPRKSNVSGRPSPRFRRSASAYFLNSSRRILPGCNSRPDWPSRSFGSPRNRSASSRGWKPAT